MLSIEQINLLQGQNEGLKKQNTELQKENIELKAENDRLKKDKIGLHSEIKQLEQENFELKESFAGQRNAYKKLNSQYIENCEYARKLEQTLQEIKEIVEQISCKEPEKCWVNKDSDYKECSPAKSNMYIDECSRKLASVILDLITKAEEE